VRLNRQSVLYSALLLSLSGFALQLLGFGYRVLLSRMLTTEGMGVYQLIFPPFGVMLALTLSGLCVASSRVVAEHSVRGAGGDVRAVVRACQRMFALLFAAVALATLLLRGFIANTLVGDERVEPALLLLLPCLLLTGVENIYKAVFQGLKDVRPAALSETGEVAVRIAAVGGLLLAARPKSPGEAAALIVAGMVIAELFSAGFLSLWYRRLVRRRRMPRGVVTRPMLSQLVRIAAPVTFSGLAMNALSALITVIIPAQLMRSGMTREQALSRFGVAFGMVSPLLMLPFMFIGPLATVILPRVSQSMARGKMGDVRRKIALSVRVTGFIALPMAAVTAAVGPELCQGIFGHTLGAGFFLLYAAACVFMYYEVLTGSLLNAMGKQKRNAVYTVVCGVLQVAIIYCTVAHPRIGLYGYALGLLAGCGLGCVLRFATLRTAAGIHIRPLRWFTLPLTGALSAGLAARLIYELLGARHIPPVAGAFAAAGAAAALYALALPLQGVRPLRQLRALYGVRREEAV